LFLISFFVFFFPGWQFFLYLIITIVAWSLYEFVTLTQRLVIYLVKKYMQSVWWYLYFFISAFEAQLPVLIWSIAVDDFVEWLLDLDDTAHLYLQRVRNCLIAVCIGISIRNLVLRYLFWEVHQKKLSDRMQRFLDIERTLQYLFERFVIRNAPFTEAVGYDGEDEGEVAEAHVQSAEEEDAIQVQIANLSAIQVLKRMQEFDARQTSLHSGDQLELHITSQSEAIAVGKELYSTFDTERKGLVPWKAIQKVISPRMNKILFAELKAYMPRMNPKDLTVTAVAVEHKEDEEYNDSQDEYMLTENALVKAFIKLFSLGEGLSQVSSAWTELSSGLKALCDAVLFIVLSLICAILWGVDWTKLIVTFPTLLVSASIAFKEALRRLILSLAFIFITKAYEVGDCVAIGGVEPLFFVESISVLTTQLRTVHNRKMMFPNWKLSEMAVYNLSKNKISKFDIFLDLEFGVSGSKLKKLRRDIGNYLKENSDSFAPEFWFITTEASVGNSIVLMLRIGLRNAFESILLYSTRRSEFLLFIRDKCQELGITYRPTIQPVELLNAHFPKAANSGAAPSAADVLAHPEKYLAEAVAN
jgi:small-conductance mechanosensitive channel